MNERGGFEILPVERIDLYTFLRSHGERLPPRLVQLCDRIERSLYDALSIEELESIPTLGDAAVEALAKKL